jgi:SET domain
VPKDIRTAIGEITVHGFIAAGLCLRLKSPFNNMWKEWSKVCPTREDFKINPIMWTSELQELLPPAAKALLENQHRKLALDFTAASNAFPEEINKDTYLYNWLIVNTRSFHWTKPGSKEKLAPDDCMCLCPFVDYFNHSDNADVTVVMAKEGYTVISDGDYRTY